MGNETYTLITGLFPLIVGHFTRMVAPLCSQNIDFLIFKLSRACLIPDWLVGWSDHSDLANNIALRWIATTTEEHLRSERLLLVWLLHRNHNLGRHRHAHNLLADLHERTVLCRALHCRI
jgi:hypothetical protein